MNGFQEVVGSIPIGSLIVLGDFNEYPYREPVALFEDSGFTNLIDRVPENQRYTYIFRGTSQVLDNFLVTKSLANDPGTNVDVVHLNADFPHSARDSDHDPILVSLAFP